MQDQYTEQSLPEIGTLKYDGAHQNPKAYVPLNFNGLSLGAHAKSVGLGDRLLRGFESMAAASPKPAEAPFEPATADMGVIRYNVPSPIVSYRMQRQRRQARLRNVGRPLLLAACLAVAVPVGVFALGKFGPSDPVAQASVAEVEMPGADVMKAAAPFPLGPEPAAPAPAAPAAVAADLPAAPVEERVVVVKSGDTLGAIAKRNKLSVAEIVRYNSLKSARALKVGQELRLPVPLAEAVNPAAAPARAEARIAEAPATAFKAPAVPLVLAPKDVAPAQAAAASQADPETVASQADSKPVETKPVEPATYTIRSGDSLSKIASRHGIKSGTLASANGLSLNETLTVGKTLKIPPADGVYVKVRAGESLSHLASRYGIKASAIQEANRITDPRSVREGQTLFLPGAEVQATARDSRRERGDFKQASRGLMGDLGRAVGKKFIWPTAGVVSSYFGSRDGRPHQGVDIPRPHGAPIHAAKGGTVVAAGWNGDYGKTVDISHGNGVVTRYAHCSKIKVKVGQEVDKGELIGLVGDTGRATGPHLHYEVRISGRPVNPSKFHN